MRLLLLKFPVLPLLIFAPYCAMGQAGSYWSHPFLTEPLVQSALEDGFRDHLSIRPMRLDNLPSRIMFGSDSGAVILKGAARDMWESPPSGEWSFGVTPYFSFSGGLDITGQTSGIYRTAPGVATHIRYGNKLSIYLDAIGGGENPPEYVESVVDSSGILPGLGRNRANRGDPSFLLPTVRIAYAPSTYFEFEAGFGKNFFGYGRQSLLLSDVAYNYPYFKIITDVWHVRYVNLFSMYTDIRNDPNEPHTYRRKFSSTHYLSWAITPKWNLGLFESIVWQGQDSLSDRGFDPNYLNPVIFFRPVEYSVGSPDNALIGLDLAYKISPSIMAYGQLLIDEFLLSEFRAGRGWWGNKWGAQIGLKTFDLFAEGLRLQAEFNLTRPFTYSHGSVLQNFGHYNQPLAHNLGSNFYEGSVYAYYEKQRWYVAGQWTYADYGRDPDSLNLGGDIFRSYVNPARIYGNEIGQGIESRLYYQKLEGGFIINRDLNLRLGLSYVYRRLNTEGSAPSNSHFFELKLNTGLYSEHRDF